MLHIYYVSFRISYSIQNCWVKERGRITKLYIIDTIYSNPYLILFIKIFFTVSEQPGWISNFSGYDYKEWIQRRFQYLTFLKLSLSISSHERKQNFQDQDMSAAMLANQLLVKCDARFCWDVQLQMQDMWYLFWVCKFLFEKLIVLR